MRNGPLNERERQLRGSTIDDEGAVANEGETEKVEQNKEVMPPTGF
jgi:hypothetical protein